MKIHLRQLRYALATARLGNMTQAADSLFVSQPAISTAINELEALYGQALFIRQRGTGMTLTPFGKRVMQKASQILRDANELENLGNDVTHLQGELVLGCFVDLAPYCLPQLLKRLHVSHPHIRVIIQEAGFDDIARQLANGGMDLALSYDLGLPPGMHNTICCELPAYAMLPPDHPLTHQPAVSLAELAAHPLILTNQSYSWQHVLDLFRFYQLQPQQLYRTHSFELQRGMVANGLGVAIAYTRPVGDHCYDGSRVAIRPIADPIPMQRILLSRDGTRPETAITTAFSNIALAWFAGRTVFGTNDNA
ncbi:LysR family transcriptional regulator [Leeia oryzae]|uniref:LysR family transcriptional regulator n=1 Tax=Leeia oryzae TaxID=356662 RepID=UPI0003771679|nr:LysR family transcriptional regulator [Leeia oryzae]